MVPQTKQDTTYFLAGECIRVRTYLLQSKNSIQCWTHAHALQHPVLSRSRHLSLTINLFGQTKPRFVTHRAVINLELTSAILPELSCFWGSVLCQSNLQQNCRFLLTTISVSRSKFNSLTKYWDICANYSGLGQSEPIIVQPHSFVCPSYCVYLNSHEFRNRWLYISYRSPESRSIPASYPLDSQLQ